MRFAVVCLDDVGIRRRDDSSQLRDHAHVESARFSDDVCVDPGGLASSDKRVGPVHPGISVEGGDGQPDSGPLTLGGIQPSAEPDEILGGSRNGRRLHHCKNPEWCVLACDPRGTFV